MSRIRALELAIDFYRGAEPAVTPDVTLVTAGLFAAFLSEGEAVQPVIADTETPPAANEAEVVKAAEVAKPAEAVKGVTEADVKAAVGKLATNAAAGGAPKAREILNSLGGATNISTLKPENYAKAVAAINAVLAAADVAA